MLLGSERCVAQTASAGLIKPNTAEEYDKKVRRSKTNMFYKQQKFNLMREENEGCVVSTSFARHAVHTRYMRGR